MANIKIPKKQFEKEIGKLDETMQNKISMFGTPVESVSSDEIELEIFPDRPDMLSYQGFKRAFLAFLGKKGKTGLKKYKIKKPGKKHTVTIDKSLKNIRPFTVCAIVKNLKFDDEKIKEIIDIQEKLHLTIGRDRKKVAIGIYPLEKITLPINFEAREPNKIKFRPLEMNREINGFQILQRHPTGRHYAHLLTGKPKFPIFIDNAKQILSMPPIINSHNTGKITEKTKEVFIECSGFNFEVLSKVLNIIVTTLAEMGGIIYAMKLKYGNKTIITPKLKPEKMKISIGNTNKLLGLNLTEKDAKKHLENMGYNCNQKGKDLQVSIPAWRIGVMHEVDLIEDIAIAYGYDNFKPEIPSISTIGEENIKEIIKRKIAEILTGAGFLEVSNYHLTKKDNQFKKMKLNENKAKFIELKESKTEYTILRKDLSHYLLKNLSENIGAEYPQKIFELGIVFDNLKENQALAVAITSGNFTDLKQILEYLSKMLDIEIKVRKPSQIPKHFIEGRTAEIILENKIIGYIGELHPAILKNWHIKMPVAIFEISLEEIFKLLTSKN